MTKDTKKINPTLHDKELKTFSIHEVNLSIVKSITHSLFIYKHLENILNILLAQLLTLSDNDDLNNNQKEEVKKIFWLLLNPIIMKAVLSHNSGGVNTSDSIEKINNYFKDNDLFIQAKDLYKDLNSHNISMLIRRLNKDWSNYFSSLKEFSNGNPKGLIGKPSYPKPKKLSKVFNYSLPLEQSKFSLKKLKQGLLGINLGKKMFYTYIGKNITSMFHKELMNKVNLNYKY